MSKYRRNHSEKTIFGTADADFIEVDAPVYGAPGVPAVVWAEDGNDTIYGSAADDALYGLGGDDVIVGAAGADFLDGGAGANWIFGEYFTDPAAYDATLDYEGADAASGYAVDSTLLAHAGYDDWLIGRDGADHIFGQFGDDFISANGGDDFLHGGTGNDEIKGGDGNDWMFGEAGNDWLKGGYGDDVMLGGSGESNVDSVGAWSLKIGVRIGHDLANPSHPRHHAFDLIDLFLAKQRVGDRLAVDLGQFHE